MINLENSINLEMIKIKTGFKQEFTLNPINNTKTFSDIYIKSEKNFKEDYINVQDLDYSEIV